jgi:DNA-binding transcriptional MerR regulator
VRISELAERTGVPVATIKWWRREGLIPPGRTTSPNQAVYSDEHAARVRLLKVLRDVADVPVAALREITAALDDPGRPLHDVVGTAHAALDRGPLEPASPEALAVVDDLLREIEWNVSTDAPARASLARAIDALTSVGVPLATSNLKTHAVAAGAVAAAEVKSVAIGGDQSRDDVVRSVVVGTILYEHVLTALRRLAQEHESSERWGK